MSFILLWICALGSRFLVIITSFLGGGSNLDSEARLLPLRLVGFIGSAAEAAKSCFQGVVAAFVLGGFHGTCGGGSKILLPEARVLPLRLVGFMGSMAVAAKSCILRRGCYLCAWWVS